MSKTKNLTVRVDEALYDEIVATAERENVDRSTVARGLLEAGLREARKRRGLEQYRAGACSLWKAAEIAGVSLREMMDLLVDARVPLNISPDDVEQAWREAFER